jgi:proteasome lid subunit RPN8/RPN11
LIRLTEAQRDRIRAHGAEAFPYECCGVLLGDVVEGVKIVREARALSNTFAPSLEFEQSVGITDAAPVLHGQERRFLISPEEMLALQREEMRTKRKILGFYHSHPNHPAQPSAYDLEWAWPWWSYLIVSVCEGIPDALTGWVLEEDRQAFQLETIEVTS